MEGTKERPQIKCIVCNEVLPPARLRLACASCGSGLHPSCAALIERSPGWGNREMFCATCAPRIAGSRGTR